MIKTINLKSPTSILTKCKMKRNLKKEEELRLEKAYDEYVYQGIMEAEELLKNGAKVYSEEEFADEMRRRYGITI